MAGGETVVVRTNDTLYGITVHPDRTSFPDYREQVEALWAQLSESVHFFTPADTGAEYHTPGEVCPLEGPDTRLVINAIEGWCALIPEGWQEDEAFDFPGRFYGGPEIGDFWPGQPPYANIVIGFGGPIGDTTLERRTTGRLNANSRPDLVEAKQTMVGGHPAVILDTRDGPHPDRVALIHANGYFYSVLGQPFDEERFPAAQPALEAAWDQIIESIRFFEPYQ
jgi:hypothetical protein